MRSLWSCSEVVDAADLLALDTLLLLRRREGVREACGSPEGGRMNAVQKAELAALIAEQEADDTTRIWQREYSLDAPVSEREGAADFHEVHGAEDPALTALHGEETTAVRVVRTRRVDQSDIKYWRYLRTRGLSYAEISRRVGVDYQTVYRHVKAAFAVPESPRTAYLMARWPHIREAYEHGATLYDIANELWDEAGFASHLSCYQRSRDLFVRHGIARRPGGWKHGKRSRTASPEEYREYCREKQALATERRRARLSRCAAVTKRGKACARWALADRDVCVIHSGLSHASTTRWTRDTVKNALLAWSGTHGRAPLTREWTRASHDHPTFKTVYNLFGTWDAALESVGLEQPVSCSERASKGWATRRARELNEDAAA